MPGNVCESGDQQYKVQGQRRRTAGAVLRGLLAFALVLGAAFLVVVFLLAAAFFAGAVLFVLLAFVAFSVFGFSDFSAGLLVPGFLSLTGPDLPMRG